MRSFRAVVAGCGLTAIAGAGIALRGVLTPIYSVDFRDAGKLYLQWCDADARIDPAVGARYQALDEAAVAHHVELEPERCRRVRGDVLDRADAHRRQRERHAELLGRARGQDLAIGVLHAGETGRREGHRHGGGLAGQGRGQRAVLHVDRDALAQLDAREVALVLAVGGLRPGARVGVVVEHARHAPLREAAQVLDAGDHGHVGVVPPAIGRW